MTSRARVCTAIAHREPVRVAMDFEHIGRSGISALAYFEGRWALRSGRSVCDLIQRLAIFDADGLNWAGADGARSAAPNAVGGLGPFTSIRSVGPYWMATRIWAVSRLCIPNMCGPASLHPLARSRDCWPVQRRPARDGHSLLPQDNVLIVPRT